jgi:phage/plasmid-like protein (TIGR03299 family)
MSHALTQTAAGAFEHAYVGAVGWHGLGNQLPAGATIEQWRVAAGMAWHVRRAAVQYRAQLENGTDALLVAHSQGGEDDAAGTARGAREVLYRSDNGRRIGFASPDYIIVQPGEVLEFFRDIAGDSGYALETAGTLFGGSQFWALAKIGEDSAGSGDAMGGYLLLSTSTDGTMATEARETTVRVVCRNTLRAARMTGGAKPVVKVSHREKFDAAAVKSQLSSSSESFAYTCEIARQLAQVKVTDAAAQEYVRRLLRPDDAKADAMRAQAAEAAAIAASASDAAASFDFAALLARPHVSAPMASDDAKRRAPKGEAEILKLFRGEALGASLPGANGTAWGLVNAVTQYVDHSATAQSVDHRMQSAFFGKGDALKTAALDAALTLR